LGYQKGQECHILRVFENRVLRRMRDEVTWDWRVLHNEGVHNLYDDNDDDQWRYSPGRALASLYEFHDKFTLVCIPHQILLR
jgi:hypothetical protein